MGISKCEREEGEAVFENITITDPDSLVCRMCGQ